MDIEAQRLKERLATVRSKLNETGWAVKQSKQRGNNKGHNLRALEAHQAQKPARLGDPVELMRKANLMAGNDLSTKEDDDLAGGSFWSSLGKIARVGSSVLGMVPSGRAQIGSLGLSGVASLTGQGKKKAGRPKKKGAVVEEPLEGGALVLGGKKKKAKTKRKPSEKMIRRGVLLKKLMKDEGLSFVQATKAIKERNLKY